MNKIEEKCSGILEDTLLSKTANDSRYNQKFFDPSDGVTDEKITIPTGELTNYAVA